MAEQEDPLFLFETIPNPHDAFAKISLRPLHVAADLFRNYLPASVARLANWETLKRQPETYLDAQLSSKFADLVFSCELQGRQAIFYILLEHKAPLTTGRC